MGKTNIFHVANGGRVTMQDTLTSFYFFSFYAKSDRFFCIEQTDLTFFSQLATYM